ncbi:MAG: fibronectin type III domain-containing protein [Firmicutes bacterium]|nr:fibronectin type III domain-containing protein [Bacillota bacterium]
MRHAGFTFRRNALLAGALFVALAVVLAVCGTAAAAAAAGSLGASAVPDHVTLTWTQDPATTQTITWRTDTTVQTGIVQYAKATDPASFPAEAQSAEATVQTLSTDLGDMNLHTVTLTGLEPGTRYLYRVGDGTRWSPTYSFTTEATGVDRFKFLVFGDSQSGDPLNPEYGPWQKTIQNAFNSNRDARFFVNVGDLVEWGQSYIHWNKWFDAAKGVVDTIPAMPVQGNHETYNPPDWHTTKPVFWTAQFKLPQNGPEGLKGQTYSFDYGDAHFVMLDSQEAEEQPVAGDILEAQKAWLEQDLQNTAKTWKIVFFHKTPYYNKATRSNEDIKAAFGPILDKYGVDVVFNGHDHGVARTYPINNDSFVSSPAQGTVYYVTGRSGNKYYTDLSAKVWDAFFYDPQAQPNYVVVQVNGSKLTIKAVNQDGSLIDVYTIDKATGLDTPRTALPSRANNTRLVVFGNMLQEPLLPAAPSQVNGKWFLPLEAFVHFLGGSVAAQAHGALTIKVGSTTIEAAPDAAQATVNGKVTTLPDALAKGKGYTLVSADALKALLGFNYKYDPATNMLMFVR